MAFTRHAVMERLRRALGRADAPNDAIVPPELAEHVVRLVHSDLGLVELFVARARAHGLEVHLVSADELARSVVRRAQEVGVGRVTHSEASVLEKLGVVKMLREAGLLAGERPAGVHVTDVRLAVAETGSVVLEGSAGLGLRWVVVEPRLLVPDLVDLLEKVAGEDVVIWSGGHMEVFVLK